jgi:hypothetical protein
VVLAAVLNWTSSVHIRGCSKYRLYVRKWREPVDLPLPLSQAKQIWSLAPVEVDVGRARYEMVAQCGAGGRPKLNLVSTYTRL